MKETKERIGLSEKIPSPLYAPLPTGISLRDYFAGQALAGILANDTINADFAGLIPRTAYQIADEMLKAREAK
jgi:hypothetical protein